MNAINIMDQSPDRKRQLPENGLKILKVTDRQTRNAFIQMPWSLYKADPMWVPPLLMERRLHLSRKNPYFEHAVCSLWIAMRDSKPVGRISAQIDRLHIERYRDNTGFWGMLEAENNIETFRALFNTAENWLHSQGMVHARGPFNLSINQECGMLVEGFNTPPSIMMGHGHPYYNDCIERCGYQKEKDLLAYIVDSDVEPSKVMKMILKRTRNSIKTRPLRRGKFQEELNIIYTIFNDAWSNNWGFIPFTKKEFEHLGKDFKLLVNEKLVRIAEVDGVPAAFILVLPNLNEVISDLNGRLLPFGWLKILWRLKIKYPKTARIPLMGVLRQYNDSLLGAALAYRMISEVHNAVIDLGIKTVEFSWILEDNIRMCKIIEEGGASVYKTYRIYGKNL